MQQEIIKAYSENFTGANDIYKKLNKKYTLQQIKDVLKNIDTNQIIGKKQQNKHLSIPISAPEGSFQADLTFYNQFKKQNHGYSLLLTIIEINTRYAYVYSLKDKRAESILRCLENLLEREKSNLKSISFDAGSEFENKIVMKFLDQHNIRYIFFNKQFQPNATMLIERFNRTIRDKISKYQHFNKQKNYVDNLKDLVAQYNNTEHSEIKMSPLKAKQINYSNDRARQKKLEINQKIDKELIIGDFVRILRNKKLFEKGQKNYSKNIYKIVDKESSNFVLRKYKDGKLTGEEIRRTAQHLMRINIFDLISNMKRKAEISKKEVKKQTNLEKKLKREGLTLKNIIEDYQQPNSQQPQPNKFNAVVFQQREQRLKQANEEISKKDSENRFLRSKSQEDLQQYKRQLQQQDEELIKKDIQQAESSLDSDYLNWDNPTVKEREKIFKHFKKQQYTKILDYFSQQQDTSQLKTFLASTDPAFKLTAKYGKQNFEHLKQIRDLFTLYNKQQLQSLKKQNQPEDSEEEEIDEQRDINNRELKKLTDEIAQIKEKIDGLKLSKKQSPDYADVIDNQINELIQQKGLLKQKYQELTDQKACLATES
ncbi:hypothetical protein ABPG74_003052 [Tetrahymena malaccensis]